MMKKLLVTTALALSLVLVSAPASRAISIESVSPAAGAAINLSAGETLVLTVTAGLEPGETLSHLEVDHSFEGESWFPEFNVYANEANPYGGAAQEAYANDVGVTVTYSASNLRWVIDFGADITQMIQDDGRDLVFFLVAHGQNSDGDDIASGHMGSPGNPMPEHVRFAYPPVTVAADEDADEEPAPGVPNTAASIDAGSNNVALLAIAGLVAISVAGVAVMRRGAHSE